MKSRSIFLIGAQKAGSSFLYELLVQSPGVVGAMVKEPNYYLARSWYGCPFQALFPARAETPILLDASTAYLHSRTDTASLIAAEQDSSVSIVCIIRDPLERAVSAYLHAVKHGRETRSAAQVLSPHGVSYSEITQSEEAAIEPAFGSGLIVERYRPRGLPDRELDDPIFNWRYVSNSFYSDQLKPWRARFGKVEIIDFQALKLEPQRVFNLLAERLDLPAVSLSLSVKTNPTVATKPLAIRAFFRNIRNRPGGTRNLAPFVEGVRRLATLELDAKRIAAQVAEAPWVAAARESYERLREKAIV